MQQLFRDAIHESNNAEAPPGKEARNKYEERLDKLLDEDVGSSNVAISIIMYMQVMHQAYRQSRWHIRMP